MSVFAYDPTLAKNWANSVVNYLDGENGVAGISKQFNAQIEKLVQPNVWTGTAAKQNYENFLQTHNALIKFSNDFGSAFQQVITNVNKSVGQLEAANLGNANATASFGSLDFQALSNLSEANIGIDVVRYNYAVISEIGSQLNSINGKLEEVNSSLIQKINELNNGSSTWDGDAAESAKEELSNIVRKNMDEIFKCLNVCIKNISTAAEAAQAADRG